MTKIRNRNRRLNSIEYANFLNMFKSYEDETEEDLWEKTSHDSIFSFDCSCDGRNCFKEGYFG